MNNTVINIQGLTVIEERINMEDSTDYASVLVIKDEYGQEVRITVCFGKITDVWKK